MMLALPKRKALIKKGQTAVEFLILVGAVLFFFIAFLFSINANISDRQFESVDVAVQEVALTFQDEVALASSSLDGYYREFTIPETVLGRPYTVELSAQTVVVRTDDNRHAIALPLQDVSGTLQKGLNTISKENGVVRINS